MPYDVIGTIHAVVQPAGDGYTATLFDANIAASGETRQDAVANLKDLILAVYEDLEEEPEERMGVEAARQLAVLRTLVKRRG
jgi:predicted RNase H-like HicB family nuclease